MNPVLTFADADVLPSPSAASFCVRRSLEVPAYHELSLADLDGCEAHWVISQPLKQMAKRSVLLWLLAATPVLSSFSCLETGTMQLAAARPGGPTSLRDELAEGLLRLNFDGQLLRGYYRLQRLPTGCGQLWQLTPIGHI